MKVKTRLKVLLPLMAVSLGTTACAPAEKAATAEPPTQPASAEVAQLHGMEKYGSLTLDDWQAYADAIVVAHVSAEKRLPSAESEFEGRDGFDLISREVTLEISRVIWSDPELDVELEDSIAFSAAGWLDDGETSVEYVMGDSSRLETGHDYVIALKRYPTQHDESDSSPASWGPVGSGSALPADGGVIGTGEYLGGEVERLAPEEIAHKEWLLLDHLGQSIDEFARSFEGFKRVERAPVVEQE